MIYRAKLVIPEKDAERADRLMDSIKGIAGIPICELSYKVEFPNGYKAQVELWTDAFSWTELKLFNKQGYLVCRTQPQNYLFSPWTFTLDENTYMIDIIREDDSITDISNVARAICSAIYRMDIEFQDTGKSNGRISIFVSTGLFTDFQFSIRVPEKEWEADPYTSMSMRLAKLLWNGTLKLSDEGFKTLIF